MGKTAEAHTHIYHGGSDNRGNGSSEKNSKNHHNRKQEWSRL